MAYADALKAITDSSELARGDVNTAIAEALKQLEAKSQEAAGIIGELENSPVADAQKWVSTARGQIDQSMGGMLDTLIDLGQRGGQRGGMPGLNTIIESTVNSLTPLAGQLTREAMTTKTNLGLKRAGLSENLGIQQAGLQKSKADLLSGIETKKGANLSDIYTKEQAELSSLEREKEKVRLALALSGSLTPSSATSVISGGYGVDPRLSNIYGAAPARSGTSGSGALASENSMYNMGELQKANTIVAQAYPNVMGDRTAAASMGSNPVANLAAKYILNYGRKI